jgi:hypothetical protein
MDAKPAKVSAAASEVCAIQTNAPKRQILQNRMPISTQIYSAGLFWRWNILQSAFIIDKESVLPAARPHGLLANYSGTISAIQIRTGVGSSDIFRLSFSPVEHPVKTRQNRAGRQWVSGEQITR